jgi:hypothetical protein
MHNSLFPAHDRYSQGFTIRVPSTDEDHHAIRMLACGDRQTAGSWIFGFNSMKPRVSWRARHRSIVRILILILSCGLATYAAPQQSQQSATNQEELGQAAAKPDDPTLSQKQPVSAPDPPTPSTKSQPSTGGSPNSAKDPASPQIKNGMSNDRLFWTLPNFSSIQGADQIPPLTAGQKFKLVARSTFDPVELTFIGVVTLTNQAENTEPAYGQGAEGYGKRYATNFADTVIENFMVGAALPSVLRQDPRYYQSGKGSFLHRFGYAISRIFVTRSDSGNAQFNFSEVLASGMAAGISTYAYHPRADKNLPNLADVWATQVTLDSISAVLKEFWPDIHRKFQKHKQQQSQ